MKIMNAIVLAAALMACGGANQKSTTPATPDTKTSAAEKGLKIKLATVYVDDQEKALHFYTDVLGFAKKDDETNGPFRWLTVTAPGDAEGTELLLSLNNDPAVKAYQQSMFQQSKPAAMFYTDDVKREYERIKAKGAEFTMPPTDVTFANIAMFKDTCGNLIQITQLTR